MEKVDGIFNKLMGFALPMVATGIFLAFRYYMLASASKSVLGENNRL